VEPAKENQAQGVARIAGRAARPGQKFARPSGVSSELKQREASFRLLFDSNPVPMIVCSRDGERILGVNDAASSITATAAPNSRS
jgi:PAS domain-containing protein